MIKTQFLLLLSSELPAPAGCLSWADIAVQSHSLRKRRDLSRKRCTVLSWAERGIDLFGAGGPVCPQTAFSSCGLGCALCPRSLGLQIHKMLISVSLQVCYYQGKMLQGKQLLTVSPRAPASPRAPFSPFAPCAERRLIRYGRRPPARQKGFKIPEIVLGNVFC